MKFLFKSIAIYCSFLILACSCKSIQDLEELETYSLPAQFDGDSIGSDSSNMAEIGWQLFFEDQKLQKLITIGLENNQDVQKTLERIRIANANLRMARVGQLPEINGIAGASSRRFGEYTMDGVGNTDANLSSTVPEDKKIPDPYRDFILGAEFNWELDFWGKYAQQKKSAAARYLASQEMINHTKTWLIAEIADLYYTIIGVDEEINILNRNIEFQENAFHLSKDLKESGRENQLAVDQFEGQFLNSKALLIDKSRELRSLKLAMAQLLGVYVEDIDRAYLDEVSFAPDIIELGIPSDLLRLRPDIRMAEKELIASNADVLSARAAFFPSIKLYGMAGFNAFEFSKLFLNPASTVYQIGGGLVAPLFNRNQLNAAFETARASQRIAYLDYEQAALTGYIEVLELVNVYTTLEEEMKLKSEEVMVQRRSLENANTMFTVGYANYLEIINSQARTLDAELKYLDLKRKQLQSIVKLYKSLGGGWL